MAKSEPRKLEVIRSRYVTPHMLRLTLGGPEFQDFPGDCNSAYIKLKMTSPSPENHERGLIRTCTVRAFDAEELELEVDFVLHERQGSATDRATSAQNGPGDLQLPEEKMVCGSKRHLREQLLANGRIRRRASQNAMRKKIRIRHCSAFE